MPGYLVSPISNASGISNIPAGTISANNVQLAINELDTEKATSGSVTTVQNNVDTVNNTLSAQISSVEGIALLGL